MPIKNILCNFSLHFYSFPVFIRNENFIIIGESLEIYYNLENVPPSKHKILSSLLKGNNFCVSEKFKIFSKISQSF